MVEAEGLFGIFGALCVLVAIAWFLERESTRPDALIRSLYLREALIALARIAGTVGVVSPALGAIRSLSYLLIWLAAAFVLLRPSPRTSGSGLWLCAFAVPVTAVLTDLGFAEVAPAPSSRQDQLTFALLVTALWRTPRIDPLAVTRYAKLVLGTMLVTSIVAIVAGLPGAPNAGNPSGDIPLIGRWSGTFSHANNLGPAGVMYLVLERLQPSRLTVRLPMGGTALLAIILAQSKAAWAAALLVATILAVAGWDRRRTIFACMASVSVAVVGALTLDPERFDVDATPIGTVSTLTGRTDLWELGLEEWRRSPWFGRGSGVFISIAERTGQDWAAQAHNAYVSALAERGLVGLAAVVAYVTALTVVALRHARATRNASLALITVLLVRTLTETPLMQFGYEELTILALAFAWQRGDELGTTILDHPDGRQAARQLGRRVRSSTNARGGARARVTRLARTTYSDRP